MRVQPNHFVCHFRRPRFAVCDGIPTRFHGFCRRAILVGTSRQLLARARRARRAQRILVFARSWVNAVFVSPILRFHQNALRKRFIRYCRFKWLAFARWFQHSIIVRLGHVCTVMRCIIAVRGVGSETPNNDIVPIKIRRCWCSCREITLPIA